MADTSIENTSEERIKLLFEAQKEFFAMGETRKIDFRLKELKKLKKLIKDNESQILDALKADFGKPPFEAFASEIGIIYEELNLAIKNLREWARPERVSTPLSSWPSRSFIHFEPKGVTLIIGPWNYPFQLVMAPLIASMAAGNTAIIKPPEQTPHISHLVGRIIIEHFDHEYVALVQGEGQVVVPQLMNNHRFDHVFFTGSVPVGVKIAEMAAPKLVPVTLELGGKSPAIVDSSAKLKVAARRIAFGKWLNAGQTCVAPDYLLVQRSTAQEFLVQLQKTVNEFFPEGALKSENYTRLVNRQRFESIARFLKEGEIYFGGEMDEENLRIAPTVLTGVSMDDKVMQEEIFGPVLPVITYDKPREAMEIIAKNPWPLAFYLFTTDKDMERTFMQNVQFGGGAVNNTVVHLSNPRLPFGGIGNSGQGNYHGRHGFLAFSHQKSVMKTATWFDLKMKYPPYTNRALQVVRWLMR